MHAALPPAQRLMLDRLTGTPGWNARMECLKRCNGDPSGDEWVHFGDMMKTLGEPLSHHLTAERSALRSEDDDDGRARALTMLFGPPDVVFEKWYGDTLMWSVTRAEFWVFNADILEALKSLPTFEVWHGGDWTSRAKRTRDVVRRCHYCLVSRLHIP
jgi:hypothetical protein